MSHQDTTSVDEQPGAGATSVGGIVSAQTLDSWDAGREAADDARMRLLYRRETPDDHSDWDVLTDVLAISGLVASPERRHIDTLLDSLPGDIVGPAVALTFGDSDVQADLLAYIQQHRARLVARLSGSAG